VPSGTCSHMGESPQSLLQGLFGTTPNPNATPPTPGNPQSPENNGPNPPKKKNFFQKLFGGGGGDKQTQPVPSSPPPQ